MENKKIYVDGVDVSKCEFYMHYDYGKFSHGCSLHKDMFGLPVCCDIADCCKDCYFKQLARKTQECKELKKELNGSEKWRIKAEGLNEKLELKNTRYLEALDDIQKIALRYVEAQGRYDILDIINKAKDGE